MLTTEEKLIVFLNDKFKASSSNKVSISRNDLPEIGLTEKDVIQSIHLLDTDELLNIVRKSVHDDLSMPCVLALKSSCVHYFENKKKNKTASRREWVRTYIPITLSTIAIILSIISLTIRLSILQ